MKYLCYFGILCLFGATGCTMDAELSSVFHPIKNEDPVVSSKSHYLAFGEDLYHLAEEDPSYTATENTLVRLSGVQKYDSDYHRCAVVSNGDAYCWGDNNTSGQLGNGTTASSLLPVKVNSTKKFTQITTGYLRTCALDDQGDVYCWGWGLSYGLGTGTNTNETSPAKALLPSPAKFVESGPYAACAITTDDKVYCWGQGSGTSPTEVVTGEIFSSLHGVVQNVMCGLKSSGELFCWGANGKGQLGVGDTVGRATPTAVLGGLLFSSITANSVNGLCGLTLDKKIYCWGEDAMGNATQTSPILVNDSSGLQQISTYGYREVCGFNSSNQKICVNTHDGTSTMIGAGYAFLNYDHGCGLTADHLLLCSGDASASGTGLAYLSPDTSVYSFLNDEDYERVFVGEYHYCAQKKNDKRLYCWGYDGGLGVGDSDDRERPVMTTNSPEFKTASLGSEITCGIDMNDDAHCTGANWAGQLGNNTTTDSLVFSPVSGGLKFSSLSASFQHVCGLTLLGQAYCWGENNQGNLGDGTTTDRLTPTQVSGGHTFKKIVTSSYSTCGLKENGTVYCWGENFHSELGDGTTTDSNIPIKVATAVIFKDIIGGGYHFCGLDSDGQAFCWGNNDSGELGDGTNTNRPNPTAVQTSLRFSQLSAFNIWYNTTCAIEKESHDIYCWGNSFNENVYSSSNIPTRLDIPSASHISVTASGILFKTSGEPVIKRFSVNDLFSLGTSDVILDLDIENSYKDYCVLENSTNQNGCVWKNGPMATSYNPQSTGFIRLTLFLRDTAGRVTRGSSPLFFRY